MMNKNQDVVAATVQQKYKARERKAFLGVALFCMLGIMGASLYLLVDYLDIKNNGPKCSSTAQCDDGMYCVSGHCKSKCTNSNQCLSKTEVCVDGECGVPSAGPQCKTAADCPASFACESGSCKRSSCERASDCPGFSQANLINPVCIPYVGCAMPTSSSDAGLVAGIAALVFFVLVLVLLAVLYYSKRALKALGKSYRAIALQLLILGIILIVLGVYFDSKIETVAAILNFSRNTPKILLYTGIGFVILSLIIFFIGSNSSGSFIDEALNEQLDLESALEKVQGNNQEQMNDREQLLELYSDRNKSEQNYEQLLSFTHWINNERGKTSFLGFNAPRTRDEALFTSLEPGIDPTERTYGGKRFTGTGRKNHIAVLNQLEKSGRWFGPIRDFFSGTMTIDHSDTHRQQLNEYGRIHSKFKQQSRGNVAAEYANI